MARSSGSGSAVEGLERAATALPGDAGKALGELQAAWRSRRLQEIAALVARTARVAARGRASVTGTTHEELQEAWLTIEKAGDPADLDRLLASLTAGRCAESKVRMARLARRDDDPRTRDLLVALVSADPRVPQVTSLNLSSATGTALPYTSQPNRTFWTQHLWPLLERLGDVAVVATLRAALRRPASSHFLRDLHERIERLLPVFVERAPAPPTADERAAIAAVAAALDRAESSGADAGSTADALYAAIWARPDDDEPRQVLADFLSERGDPRGEFIALQMARHHGTISSDGKKREKELLKRHKKEWLGPIAPLIQPYNIRFERGFIVTCQLEPNAELEKTLGKHPAWSTIREYLVHGYSVAEGSGKKLVKRLESHGAVALSGRRFTRGIE